MGRLFRGDDEVGLVLVEVEPYAEQVGGRLWWTRWTPTRDVVWTWTVVDGRFSDSLVPEDAADDELQAYDTGRFDHYGETLDARWTDEAESRLVRASRFGGQMPFLVHGGPLQRRRAGVSLRRMTQRDWHSVGALLLIGLGGLSVAISVLGDRERAWWASAVTGLCLRVLGVRWLNEVRKGRALSSRR